MNADNANREAAMRSVRVLVVALALALAPRASQPAESETWKVIVHGASPVATLSRDEVNRLFLKKNTTWPDGSTVIPVDLPEGSAVRAAFSKAVLRKSVPEVRSYWENQVFSGRGVPPLEKASDRDVIAFVEGNPKAIGYVAGDAVGAFKVLKVVD